MRRRDLITLLGGAAATWPVAARGQQAAMPVVGFLNARPAKDSDGLVAAFRTGLNEVGYVEGRNVVIEYRWAEGHFDRLPTLAAGLVRKNVAAIASFGGVSSARAAMAATGTIPIVFSTGSDPVNAGLVASLNRPGENVTGVNFYSGMLGAKRLDLLRALIPKADRIGVLVNPNSSDAPMMSEEVQNTARVLGLQAHTLNAGSESDLDAVFATIVREHIVALIVSADPFLSSQRYRLAELATRFQVPAMFQFRDHAVAGGLMSYGASIADSYRQVGVYVGRILKGEKPADLPVLQPTKFEFVINLKTAKALGLTVPPMLLALADEVIE